MTSAYASKPFEANRRTGNTNSLPATTFSNRRRRWRSNFAGVAGGRDKHERLA